MLTTLPNLTTQNAGKPQKSDDVLRNAQIRYVAVKCSNSGQFRIFFKFPFFAPMRLIIQYLGGISAFVRSSAVGYDGGAHAKYTTLREVSADFHLWGFQTRPNIYASISF